MRQLQFSLGEGHWDRIRDQLKTSRGQDNVRERLYVDPTSKQKVTALHLACRQGAPVDIIREILTISPELSGTTTDEGSDLPLHFAVSSNRMETAEIFLDVNPMSAAVRSSRRGAFGNQVTPLHVAVMCQVDVAIVELLLRTCPPCRALRSASGETAYHLALRSNYKGVERERVLKLLRPPGIDDWEASRKVVVNFIRSVIALQVLQSLVMTLRIIFHFVGPMVMTGMFLLKRPVITETAACLRKRSNSFSSLGSSDGSSKSHGSKQRQKVRVLPDCRQLLCVPATAKAG